MLELVKLLQSQKFVDHFHRPGNYAEFIVGQINDGLYNFTDFTDKVILDIGGNVGLFSLYASQTAKQVYAAEPTPAHAETFRDLVATLDIKNIDVNEVAISKVSGEITFFLSSYNSTMNSLYQCGGDGRPTKAQALTLSDFMDSKGIEYADFAKIDVEGSEMDILSTFDQKLADRIGQIFIECHDWHGEGMQNRVNRAIDILTKFGYTCEQLGNDSIKAKR